MLYLVGLGLGNAKDITVKGLEIVQSADRVYLEAYTSILCGDNSKHALVSWTLCCRMISCKVLLLCPTLQEQLYGREVLIADREFVESDDNKIIEEARDKNVVLLVVGDPFG